MRGDNTVNLSAASVRNTMSVPGMTQAAATVFQMKTPGGGQPSRR